MKNFASIFGWVLLAGVLAVPSFLFYNWWSANKAKEAQLAASQQGVPRDFFPSQEGAAAPRAEASPAPSASAEAPVPEARPEEPAGQEAARAAAPPAAGEIAPAPRTAAETPPVKAAAEPSPESPAAQPAAESAAAPEGGGGRTADAQASYFKPVTDRNPFFTPEDYARIRAEEYRRRQEARDRARAAAQVPREVLVESRMNIQGIVGTNVIINGEMYSRGDTVMGARIISIGSNYIIGEHKGRRFRKYMQ